MTRCESARDVYEIFQPEKSEILLFFLKVPSQCRVSDGWKSLLNEYVHCMMEIWGKTAASASLWEPYEFEIALISLLYSIYRVWWALSNKSEMEWKVLVDTEILCKIKSSVCWGLFPTSIQKWNFKIYERWLKFHFIITESISFTFLMFNFPSTATKKKLQKTFTSEKLFFYLHIVPLIIQSMFEEDEKVFIILSPYIQVCMFSFFRFFFSLEFFMRKDGKFIWDI